MTRAGDPQRSRWSRERFDAPYPLGSRPGGLLPNNAEMTLPGKIALSLALLVLVLSVGIVAREVSRDGPREVVQGAAIWAVLALVLAIAVVIADFVWRWTRRAAQGLRQRPPE